MFNFLNVFSAILGDSFDNNGEDRMVYFTEDIGLNNYYYFSRISNSRLVNSHQMYQNTNNKESYNLKHGMKYNNFLGKVKRRGERYLYQMKQLLARYNLERQSNGLEYVKLQTLDGTIDNGAFPNLRYINGLQMPSRQNEFLLKKEQNIRLIQVIRDFENRFYQAIDQGYVTDDQGHKVSLQTKDGINILGNLLQGNRDSVNINYYRYLEYYYRLLFGGNHHEKVDFDDYRFVPTALDHHATAMRDPVFWQILERLNNIVDKFKSKLIPYTTNQLDFEGVKINNVKVDKMFTKFTYYDSDLSNVMNAIGSNKHMESGSSSSESSESYSSSSSSSPSSSSSSSSESSSSESSSSSSSSSSPSSSSSSSSESSSSSSSSSYPEHYGKNWQYGMKYGKNYKNYNQKYGHKKVSSSSSSSSSSESDSSSSSSSSDSSSSEMQHGYKYGKHFQKGKYMSKYTPKYHQKQHKVIQHKYVKDMKQVHGQSQQINYWNRKGKNFEKILIPHIKLIHNFRHDNSDYRRTYSSSGN